MLPFTRAEGVAAGLTERQLRGCTRVFTGIYLAPGVELTPLRRAQAALRIFDGQRAWLSHASAARVIGVPIPTLPDEHVTVLADSDRRDPFGVSSHVRSQGKVTFRHDVPVSAPAQLFIELTSQLSLVDLVVAGDHLLHAERLAIPALTALVPRLRGRERRLADQARSSLRVGSESAQESRTRMLLHLAGCPEPHVNATFPTLYGTRRFDLSWPEARVIVEYDGRHHIDRVDQWQADLIRREGIELDGWRIIVLTAADLYRTPEQTLDRVWQALRAGRAAGLPARPSELWRPYFPTRASVGNT